jgi:hypothetical protein
MDIKIKSLPYTSKEQASLSAFPATIKLSVALISKSSSSLSYYNYHQN